MAEKPSRSALYARKKNKTSPRIIRTKQRQDEALQLRMQHLDYKEIGKVLKLSESATKSLLFRAYETLRERLKEFV